MKKEEDRDQLLALNDVDLLKRCRCDCFRATGPGGQHRNTTDSAVRLTYEPRQIAASCVDHRSQIRNRSQALRRLRLQLALDWRKPPVAPWNGPWDMARKNPRYPQFVAIILDFLEAADYRLSDAGKKLGRSTGQLVRLLGEVPQLWEKVNQERERRKMKRLRRS